MLSFMSCRGRGVSSQQQNSNLDTDIPSWETALVFYQRSCSRWKWYTPFNLSLKTQPLARSLARLSSEGTDTLSHLFSYVLCHHHPRLSGAIPTALLAIPSNAPMNGSCLSDEILISCFCPAWESCTLASNWMLDKQNPYMCN